MVLELDSLSLREKTIVLFTSDNGALLAGDFDRYEPVFGCNTAMQKFTRDGVWYQGMYNLPHFEIDGVPERPFIERELPLPGEPELYNVEQDTYKAHTTADAEPERTARMRMAIESWFERVEHDRRAVSAREGRI